MNNIKFDGNKLFEIRREKKMSQGKLASIIGVTRQTVHLWETNQSLPDVEKVSKICKILDIKLSDLVDGVEEKKEIQEGCVQDSSENIVKKEEVNSRKKKIFFKILGFILLIFIIIYMIISFIKFSRLNKILNKLKGLDKVNSYYLKVNEYLIDKNSISDISENISYEKYYKDGILKVVIRDSKEENIKTITVYDYNTGNKYIIDENKKSYVVDKIEESDENYKLTYNFKTGFSNNNFINYIVYCLNPNIKFSYNEDYIFEIKGDVRKDFDSNTGVLKYEENLDSSIRKTKSYYEVELDTDKDFEINLDEYTKVTQ